MRGPEYLALAVCALTAAGGGALLRWSRAEPTHRLLGWLLVALAGTCAGVVLLAAFYEIAFLR